MLVRKLDVNGDGSVSKPELYMQWNAFSSDLFKMREGAPRTHTRPSPPCTRATCSRASWLRCWPRQAVRWAAPSCNCAPPAHSGPSCRTALCTLTKRLVPSSLPCDSRPLQPLTQRLSTSRRQRLMSRKAGPQYPPRHCRPTLRQHHTPHPRTTTTPLSTRRHTPL